MKLSIQFAGYKPFSVDTENGTCGVFEKLTVTEASGALESAVNGGDEDNDGWIAACIGGEDCQVRREQ